MKPEQALAILSEASALAPMPKQNHLQVEMAVKVLSEIIKNLQKDKSDEK
jgi:hypothetical protein